MAVKIRMSVLGRRNRPFYRIVVADVRSPRDGRCIETIGWYNPIEKEESRQLEVDAARVAYWLERGAQLTEKVDKLIERAAPEMIRAHREKKRQVKERQRAKSA